MGRPTVMTPEVIAKLEEAFAWGCTDVEACLHAGIVDDTLYKYQRENPSFIKRKAALKETPILLARKAVVSKFSRDGKLAMDYLSKKRKDEFGNTTTEINIHMPQPILGGESRKVIDVSVDDSDQKAIEAGQEA